jgi:hypothetical protein
VILDSFTALGENKKYEKLVGDVPFKLVRFITQSRKSRDHWENTQENMFCLNALIDYSRVYEKTTPNMEVTTAVDDNEFGEAKFSAVSNPPITVETPIQEGDAGRKAKVTINKQGEGRLYYSTRLQYALAAEFDKPTNAGIDIRREYSVERDKKWVLLKSPMQIKKGELVRVDLYMSLPTARNFVVVNDPVPGGLEPLNRDLATTSTLDADKAENDYAGGSYWFKFNDWFDYGFSRWSFYHQELRHNAVIYYSDYLEAGNYHLSYTAQAIAGGEFTVMPTSAEEMYDPDVFGKAATEKLVVQ